MATGRDTGTTNTLDHNNNPQRLQQGASNEHPKNVVVVDEKIVRLLKGRGIAQPQAQQLASEYEAAQVQRQLQHLDWLKARGQGPASEPAWLVSAIRHAYGLPPKLQQQISKRQRAKSVGDGQAGREPSAEVSVARPAGGKARPSPQVEPSQEAHSQEKPSQEISAETAAALSAATAALEGGDRRIEREARLRKQARRAHERLSRHVSHLRHVAGVEAPPEETAPWPVFYAPEGYLWQLEDMEGSA